MAPAASARSAGAGSATKRQCPAKTLDTRPGSTGPSPTTTGSSPGRLAAAGVRLVSAIGRPVAERGTRYRGYLVPGAVLGRGGHGRDDLGVRKRLGDGGVALLASADRNQEFPGLDDLEVVVAHAVSRPRLEPAVVAHGGVADHGGVSGVGPAAAQAQPELVHLLKVPDGRSFGAVDLEAEPALRAHADPGRLQGADGTTG